MENTNNSGQSAEELIRNEKCTAALDDSGTPTSLQSVTYSDTTWSLLFNCNSVFGSTPLRQALAEVAREDYEAGILAVDDWSNALLCPMVDARRMEVYAQVFDAEGRPQSEVSAEVVDAGSFAAFRGQGRPFVIFGSGARKCAGILSDAVCVEVTPSARGLARLAQQALDEGRTEDIAYFEPFYLKDFVVTTSRKKLF